MQCGLIQPPKDLFFSYFAFFNINFNTISITINSNSNTIVLYRV